MQTIGIIVCSQKIYTSCHQSRCLILFGIKQNLKRALIQIYVYFQWLMPFLPMRLPDCGLSMEAVWPTSVHCWLKHELEQHGIDSQVYARYIISLLMQVNNFRVWGLTIVDLNCSYHFVAAFLCFKYNFLQILVNYVVLLQLL